jgi:hypothetical protein
VALTPGRGNFMSWTCETLASEYEPELSVLLGYFIPRIIAVFIASGRAVDARGVRGCRRAKVGGGTEFPARVQCFSDAGVGAAIGDNSRREIRAFAIRLRSPNAKPQQCEAAPPREPTFFLSRDGNCICLYFLLRVRGFLQGRSHLL